MASTTGAPSARAARWRKALAPRALFWQGLLLLGLFALFAWISGNAQHNLAERSLTFGFGFLAQTAGFDIPFHVVDWSPADSYGRALWVCIVNTLLVSAMAVVTATVLGVLLGIMRLSSNGLVRGVALVIVEAIRNTPQLIQLVFWYGGVLQALPPLRQSLALPGGIFLNVRGLFVPAPILESGGGWTLLALAASLVLLPILWTRQVAGRRVGAWALLLPAVLLLLALSMVEGLDRPALKGFNFTGGLVLIPELVALWLGLSVYAAAFVAEIVRGSIIAVPHGQREAARAMGLHAGLEMLLVVLPQALRTMIPPLTSQYLNIIKSSSLGAAIAYPEIVQIFAGTVLNQSGRAIEAIVLVMGFFLAVNLSVSALMGIYNQRLLATER
jgi:general L-amino acid transport system permease protein